MRARLAVLLAGILLGSLAQAQEVTEYSPHPMHDLEAGQMHRELPDGRGVLNVAVVGRIRKDLRDPKINPWHMHPKPLVIAHPDVIAFNKKHGHAPYAGITLWLKRNPDIFTVTYDHGFYELPMAYAVLAPAEDDVIVGQMPGFEPVEFATVPSGMPEEKANPYYRSPGLLDSWRQYVAKPLASAAPEPVTSGPSDWRDHRRLGDELLRIRGQRRQRILDWMDNGGAPAALTLSDGAEIRPIYLCGRVVSAADGRPIEWATVWLLRNPCIHYRTRGDGTYEIMMLEGTLYRKDEDKLMVTSPGYQPTEVPVESYLNEDLTIKMKPQGELETLHAYEEMVKIPAGFFRMGRGGVYTHHSYRGGATFEFGLYGGDWPVKTVYMPSFYIASPTSAV